MNIFHCNIRSLSTKKIDELEAILDTFDTEYDIIVCTECWLSSDKIHLLNLEGYNALHAPAVKNKADGVSMFLKKDLPYEIIQNKFVGCTGLTVKLKFENKDLIVTGIYRSPSGGEEDLFLTWFDEYLSQKTPMHVLVGDFNIDLLHPNDTVRDYCEVLINNDYDTLINQVTRPNLTNGKGSCLDHIHVKNSANWTLTANVIKHDITDHYPIECKIGTGEETRAKGPGTSILKTKLKINWTDLESVMSNINWLKVVSKESAEEAMEEFYNILNTVTSQCSHIVKTSNKQTCIKPWMTVGILNSLRIRNKLHRQLTKNKDDLELKSKYTYYRNMVTKLIRTSKDKYYQKELEKADMNPKKFWDIINKLGGRKKFETPNCQAMTAETLNKYYSTVGEVNAQKIQRSHRTKNMTTKSKSTKNKTYETIFLNPIDQYEVMNIISGLKNTMSRGADDVSMEILKRCAKWISLPIAFIINLSFSYGVFPVDLKKAKVIPIYKSKGSFVEPGNYRPISVLSNISKIFETAIKTRLMTFINKNNIMPNNQYGFLKGKNTTQAIAELIRNVTDNLEKKNKCAAVFLDLSKAFDSVSHIRLLEKLEKIGIRGKARTLFASYLKHRTQFVNFGGINSSEEEMKWGVPQGSVLGPLLFLLYTKGLCKYSQHNLQLIAFADDMVLIFNENSWEALNNLINKEMNMNIKPWLDKNLLSLNLDKTVCMPFLTTNFTEASHNLKITIHQGVNCELRICDCPTLKVVDNTKYLGVILDSNLSWHEHAAYLEGRLRRVLFTLSHLRRFLSIYSMRLVYMALFQSILSYGIATFGAANNTVIAPLIRLQRKVIKVILRLPKRYPSSELNSLLDVPTFQELYEKDLKRMIPVFRSHFKFERVNYGLRDRVESKAMQPFLRLELSRRNFWHNLISYYNSSNDLRGQNTV